MALQQPKKPVGGAYGTFLSAKRAEFTKACAGQRASAISTMAGAAWKQLSEPDKAPFQKQYEANKAQYDIDLAAFLKSGGKVEKGPTALRSEKRKAKGGGGSGKKAKNEDPNRPRKPAGGGYGCFLTKNRDKLKAECDGSVTAIAKLAGERWKAMSAEAKNPFEKDYLIKKAAYEEAMKTYVPPSGDGAEGDDDDDAGSPDDA